MHRAAGLAFLLLAGTLLPTYSAQTPPATWALEDKPNDLVLRQGGQTVPLSHNGIYGSFDLRRIELTDPDDETLLVRFKSAVPMRPPEGSHSGGSYPRYLAVSFQLPKSATFATVQVNINMAPAMAPDPFGAYTARLCFSDQPNRACDYGAILQPRLRLVGGDAEVIVPKLHLVSHPYLPQPGSVLHPLPRFLAAGESLTRIVAWSEETIGQFVQAVGHVQDRAPDTGEAPPYALTHASPLADLFVTTDRTAIVAGELNRIQLRVHNAADQNRLMHISASLVEPASAGEWTFAVSRHVQVRANSTLNVSVRVQPPPVQEGEERRALLGFGADVVGQPGAFGVHYVTLAAQKPLDKDHRRLWLHGWGTGGAFGVSTGFLSRLEVDPDANDATGIALVTEGPLSQTRFASSRTFYFQPWVPNPVRVLPEPVKATIVLASSFPPMDARLQIGMPAYGDAYQVIVDAPIRLQQGRNQFEFQFPYPANRPILEPGAGGSLFVRVYSNATEHAAFGPVLYVQPLRVLTPATFLDMPVEALARGASPELASIQMESISDAFDFANPGQTKVFEVLARNEDEEPVAIQLGFGNRSLPWNVSVVPGNSLTLAKYESARFAVRVDVPERVPEGAELSFQLVAFEATTKRELAREDFRVVATRGVQFENDTYEPDADSLGKFATPTRKSPAPGALAIAATVGLVVIAFGRRKNAG